MMILKAVPLAADFLRKNPANEAVTVIKRSIT
jgi:hypothetical protein